MSDEYIFISYSTHDSDFVRTLRQSLEESGISVWVDAYSMRGGSKLKAEIAEAIGKASHTIVVLSPRTVNSPWVRDEILATEKERNDGYRTIPTLLPGIEPSALGTWFPEEPLALPISLEPGALQEAMPGIMAALGREMPSRGAGTTIVVKPCAQQFPVKKK